jgi:hypothetical protein
MVEEEEEDYFTTQRCVACVEGVRSRGPSLQALIAKRNGRNEIKK